MSSRWTSWIVNVTLSVLGKSSLPNLCQVACSNLNSLNLVCTILNLLSKECSKEHQHLLPSYSTLSALLPFFLSKLCSTFTRNYLAGKSMEAELSSKGSFGTNF